MWTCEAQDGGVVVAVYDNPPMGYVVAEATAQFAELVDAWADPAVRAVVLTGPPGRFLTHNAVEEVVATAQGPLEARVEATTARVMGLHRLLERIRALPKPVIAGMTGDTMGGGLIVTMACDLRIAQRGADHLFGLPEVRLGIVPSGSGVQRLSRLIGVAAAADLALRARMVGPEEALRLGLVHELADDPRARAIAVAHELAALPPVAMATTKHALYAGADLPLDAAVALESDAAYRAKLSPQAAAAMEAFLALPLDDRRVWLAGEAAPTG